jgi:hypothetical protein
MCKEEGENGRVGSIQINLDSKLYSMVRLLTGDE